MKDPEVRVAVISGRSSRAFTLIEMVFVLGIIALLALMTIPLYMERNIQLQVKEGVEFAGFMQRNVSAAYALSGALPKDNAGAGLPAPEKVIGNYIVSGTVSDGVITLVFGNLAVKNIRGRKLTLRPGYVADAPQVPISWVCGPGKMPAGLTIAGSDATDIPQQWLPAACRP
ncbi:MAG: pilin [Betaproteobacteria bacterium]